MRIPPILAALVTVSVMSLVAVRADVVTQPVRRFGLGDLLQTAVSPDGRWMATAGSGGAFIWGFEDGTLIHRLEAHHARVSAISFSPDGGLLLTGGFDRMIRAWNVATGQEVRSFAAHFGSISDLAFSPDGRTFASAGENTARVWSLDTGDLLRTLTVPGASVIRVRFTPDGSRLVTTDGSLANNIRVWSLDTGQTIRSFGSFAQELAFVSGGHLVAAGNDLVVQVWDIDTGEVVRPLTGATHQVVGLETSKNSPLVIAGCHNGRVIAWNTSSGAVEHDFMGEPLMAITAVQGTNQLVTGHPNNLVRVKHRETGDNLRVFSGHTTSTTTGVGFSPDGRYVVSGGVEVFTRLWNRTNAQPHLVLPGHGAGTQTAVFSPDGHRVLTTFGAPIHSAQLWNAHSGLVEREFFGHTGWLLAAVFSPDGQRVATGAQDGTARLWDVPTGAHVRTFTSPGSFIRSVAVSPNGAYLASGDTGGLVRLWNVMNGQQLRTFELNAGAVTSLAFSPATGELLVTWSDGFLRTFDPVTGELQLDSVAPAAFLETAAFSPDGRFILGGEGWPYFTARLWDARDGEELRVFAGHAAPVTSVAFSSTGATVLTGSDIVRLWSIADITARVQSERRPGGLELRWHTGTLQHAPNLAGPWLELTGAVNPQLISTDQPTGFFRVETTPED